MRSSTTAGFCKLNTCPSAETLLRYHEAALTRGTHDRIAAHLTGCDLCGAETFLLARHYRASEPVSFESVAMPAALRRLAEDLLSAATPRALTIFAEVTLERERLTLTDA